MTPTLMLIANIGTKSEPANVAQKTRLLNIIILLTSIIAIAYAFSYAFLFENNSVAIYNTVFAFSYFLSFIFNHFHYRKLAKNWYFCVVMLHIFICSTLFFSKEAAFHLYYLLIPTGILLIYDVQDNILKILLSASSIILFLYCENTINENPLIVLSPFAEHILFQSAFLINMFVIILVLIFFVKQIEKSNAKLVKQASTDVLTGLNNRRYFFEQGEGQLQVANSLQQHSSLILLDLDFFKQINDQYGHAIGDQCLVLVGEVLMAVEPNDKLCSRIGGEEFAILLIACDSYSAIKVAEKIRLKIKELSITTSKGDVVKMTASLGISVNTSKNENLTILLEKADVELYKAKQNGRDQLAVVNH